MKLQFSCLSALVICSFLSVAEADPLPQVSRGAMLFSSQQYVQALAQYEEAFEIRPESARVVSGYVTVLSELNRCDEALNLLEPRRGNVAVNVETSTALAACFARLGDYAEAVYWKEESVFLGEFTPRALSLLSLFRYRLGDIQGAQLALDEATEIDPLSPSIYVARATVAIGIGRPMEAIEILEELDMVRGSENQISRFLRLRAMFDMLGGVPEVFTFSRQVMRQSMRFLPGVLLRAELLRRGGDLLGAKNLIQRPWVRRSSRSGVPIFKARLAVDMEEYGRAAELVQDLLGGNGLDPEVLATAWYYHHRIGNAEVAAQYEELYYSVQPNELRRLELLIP
jgi:tetratricopeptide (TPR) repeat protein